MPFSLLLPTDADVVVASRAARAGALATERSRRLDVRMVHTADGGTIVATNGVFELADGLFNAVYLSLFGGNERDSGLQADDRQQWWGNFVEPDAAKRYRSETQALLRSLPAIPANMKRVEEAAGRDLAWLIDSKISSLISPLVTLPALNTIELTVNMEFQGNEYLFDFTDHWGAAA